MKKIVLVNAFSLNMLPSEFCTIEISSEFQGLKSLEGKEIINAIGHKETANIVSDIAAKDGILLPEASRQTIKLDGNERVLVAQYIGPRLPEGAMSLPEGAKLVFRWVDLVFINK